MHLKTEERVVDRHTSHIADDVIPLLSEALCLIESRGRDFIQDEIDFSRVIGVTTCVETSEDDEIYFAQRPHRNGPTRFVRNRAPEPCSHLTVVLKRTERSGVYVSNTAYIGRFAGPEPWDPFATPKSREFSRTHALIDAVHSPVSAG